MMCKIDWQYADLNIVKVFVKSEKHRNNGAYIYRKIAM